MFGEISNTFIQLMINLLDFLKSVTGSYGLAIILFSVIIKIALYYPTESQYKSMKEMQKIQPHIKKIQEKYKDDPQRQQVEQMELFKKYKVNPLAGCLPLLIQMPILIGIFVTIRKMAELGKFTGETFLWIGGSLSKIYPDWIGASLAQKDYPLVLIYSLSMYLSQKMTPATDPSSEGTQKLMNIIMPVFFGFILKDFPSSLILYWLVFNILSIVQQYFIMRDDKPTEGANMTESVKDEKETEIETKKEKVESSDSRLKEVLPTGRSLSRSRKKKGGK